MTAKAANIEVADKAKFPDTVDTQPGLILSFENGNLTLNHTMIEEAFGSKDHGFVNGLMGQIVQMAVVKDRVDPITVDFIGGALMELKPRNGMEAVLVSQIVGNHLLTMKLARMLATASTIEQMQRIEVMFTKTARTATAQMEALHKLRNGGKQKVTVKHVHVNEGGQAIIGNVDRGAG